MNIEHYELVQEILEQGYVEGGSNYYHKGDNSLILLKLTNQHIECHYMTKDKIYHRPVEDGPSYIRYIEAQKGICSTFNYWFQEHSTNPLRRIFFAQAHYSLSANKATISAHDIDSNPQIFEAKLGLVKKWLTKKHQCEFQNES